MNTVFVITMLLNSVPQGTPTKLHSLTPNCGSEIAMVEGMNRSEIAKGSAVRYVGKCVTDGR